MSAWVELVNRAAEGWVELLWPVVWQSAILAAFIWIIVRRLKGAPAALRFWLWMLVPLRLAAMPLLTISLPLRPAPVAHVPPPHTTALAPENSARIPRIVAAPQRAARDSEASTNTGAAAGRAAAPTAFTSQRPTIWACIFILWSAGVAFSVAKLLGVWLRIRRMIQRAQPLADPALLQAAEQAAQRMGLRQAPKIVITHEPVSPMVLGIFRPVVVLPQLFAAAVSQELIAVLSHEFAHIRRRDPLTGWLLGICQALYFFHPAFHVAKLQSLREREQACDECVLALANAQPHAYARVLIAAAEACRTTVSRIAPAPVVAESFGDLKRRVAQICSIRQPRARLSRATVFALWLVTILILPGIAITVRNAIAAPAQREVQRVTVEVTDAGGKPVAYAPVEAISDYVPVAAAQTDTQGRAVLEIPVDVRVQWVIAAKAMVGFDYHENGDETGIGRQVRLPADVPLVLDGVRSVRIHAVDSQGKDVAGVRFVPWTLVKKKGFAVNLSGSRLAAAVSDDKGMASFNWLPTGEGLDQLQRPGLTFLAQGDEYDWPDPPAVVRPNADGVELTATVLRKGTIRGRVVLADGSPAPGIRVVAEGRGKTIHFGRAEAVTAADGTYSMRVAAEQSYMLSIIDENWTAADRTGVVMTEGAVQQGIDFSLNKGSLIHGRVLTKAGQPIAGEMVLLKCRGAALPEQFRGWSDREWLVREMWSDAEGHYAFRVPPGEYTLGGVGTVVSAVHPSIQREANGEVSRLAPEAVAVSDGNDVLKDLEHRSDKATGTTGSIVKANDGKPYGIAALRIDAKVAARFGDASSYCMYCHRPHLGK